MFFEAIWKENSRFERGKKNYIGMILNSFQNIFNINQNLFLSVVIEVLCDKIMTFIEEMKAFIAHDNNYVISFLIEMR